MKMDTEQLYTRLVSLGVLRPSVLISIVLVVLAWEAFAATLPQYRLPGLRHLFTQTWVVISGQSEFDFLTNYGISLLRIMLGFVTVMIVGTFVGVIMGVSRAIEDYVSTYIILLLTVPSVIWAFMAVIWWGFTELLVPVFVITMIIFPYVIINMWEGTKDLDGELMEMATAFKLPRRSVWRDIYIPHLKPYTFATMRWAFALSWQLSLVGEIFGSDAGIGVVVQNYYQLQQSDMILAWALPMMILVFTIDRLMQRVEDRAYKWMPDGEGDSIDVSGGRVI